MFVDSEAVLRVLLGGNSDWLDLVRAWSDDIAGAPLTNDAYPTGNAIWYIGAGFQKVEMGLESGASGLHGSRVEFFRGDSFDAGTLDIEQGLNRPFNPHPKLLMCKFIMYSSDTALMYEAVPLPDHM